MDIAAFSSQARLNLYARLDCKNGSLICASDMPINNGWLYAYYAVKFCFKYTITRFAADKTHCSQNGSENKVLIILCQNMTMYTLHQILE